MTTTASPEPADGTRYWESVSPSGRWIALALLFTASTLNLLDRQIVGILAEQIKLELQLSDTQLGLLTGTAFGIMYAFFTVPISRLSDHVSRTRLIAVAMTLWSAFTIFCGQAVTFSQLLVARMGVGIGAAGSQPAAASLVIDYFPPRQRGLAMAIFYLGVPLGGCLGLLLGAFIGSTLGWRYAFTFAGAPGIALGITMWVLLRDPREPRAMRSAHSSPRETFASGLARAVRTLLAIRSYRLLTIASTAGAAVQNMAAAWFPVYLVRVHGMSLMEVAAWMSAAVAIGGTIGALGNGWACDRLRGRVRRPESLILTIGFAIVSPALVFTCLVPDKMSAVAGLMITYVFAFVFSPPATLLVQKAAPDDMRGIAVGLWSSIMNVISLTIILPLIGLGSDLFTAAFGVRGLAYALACSAIIPLVGAVFFTLAGRAM